MLDFLNLKLSPAPTGKYAEIKKKWRPDDEINLTLDMRCRLIDAPKGGSASNSDRYKALQYGPLTLCRNSETDLDYNKLVTVVPDGDGFVDAKPEMLPDGSMTIDIPTTTGSIRMSPYANINGWNGAKIQTWLPMLES